MKSYTDIEQSKKLAEILSLNSADMCWISIDDDESFDGSWEALPKTNSFIAKDDKQIPCWSLAALMGVLPDNCGIDKEDGNYVASYITVLNECGAYTKDNPIDACYEMIMYFHKLNLL